MEPPAFSCETVEQTAPNSIASLTLLGLLIEKGLLA